MKTVTIKNCRQCPDIIGHHCGNGDTLRHITCFPSFPDWCPIPDTVEQLEWKAAKAAWFAARERYTGVLGGEIPAEMAFNKWYDQWKEETK